jgi:hypothetical protein
MPIARSAALSLVVFGLIPIVRFGMHQAPANQGTVPAAPTPPSTLPIPMAALVTIRVDALTPDPDAGSAFKDAVSTLSTSNIWADWVHPEGQPVRIARTTDASYAASAVRYRDGAIVFLKNLSNQKLPTAVEIKLPAGLFAIERVTSGLASPGSTTLPAPKFERLQGVAGGRQGVIKKALTLEPGQWTVYRFADEALKARRAMLGLRISLHALGDDEPALARRVRSMLAEGHRYESGINASGDDEDARLERVHHLLLTVSQAQSVLQNYASQGSAAAERSRASVDAVQELSAGVAGVSAILLGLVPQVATEASTPAAGASPASGTLVTVSLTNTGSRSVSLVKLGLSFAGLPANITVDPPDPDVFKSLRPGQTVRAQYTIHGLPAGSEQPRCTADVSYFAYGIPAHLHPSSW